MALLNICIEFDIKKEPPTYILIVFFLCCLRAVGNRVREGQILAENPWPWITKKVISLIVTLW